MLFFTSITTAKLPRARFLAQTLKQNPPQSKFYVVLCDNLPAGTDITQESFDGVLYSADFDAGSNISAAYWHFLHNTDALCSAVKPWAASILLEKTNEDKIVYLGPDAPIPTKLDDLDRLLDSHPILIAPHPLLQITGFDPRQSVYDPNFIAIKNIGQGAQFLRRWRSTAQTLWQTPSPIDAFAYDRLLDAVPALYDSCIILQDRYFAVHDNAADKDPLTMFPCIYGRYDNGELISEEDRITARRDAQLLNSYGHTDPYLTQTSDCLYQTLRRRESNAPQTEGLYWAEYQEILHSTSYRVGKKLVNTANKLLPSALFDKLRRKPLISLEPLEPIAEPEALEIIPLYVPNYQTPTFSVVLLEASDFEETYRTLHSIICNNEGTEFEILIANNLVEVAAKLLETVNGICISASVNLNDLLTEARGRYVLLLNDQITVPTGFLNHAANLMEQTNTAVMQSKVCFSNGKIYEAGGVMLQSGQRLSYGFGMHKDLGCVRYYKEIDCPAVWGTIIDMNAYREIDCLDNNLSPIYQLADLSFALRRKGMRTMFIPEAELYFRCDCTESCKPFAPASDAYPFTMKWNDTLAAENIADTDNLFYGRDRSLGKMTVFAVDDRIPCYDLSAGDRNTYQYYETMADMGYNLKIVGNDFARQEPYATKLERLGIEIVAADGRGEVEYREFLRDYGKFVDAAYLNRPNNLAKYTPEVKKYNPKARIVYCCHDLHFLRELREHEVNGNQKEAERVRNYAREEISRMDIADVIFDVSAYEKSILDPQLKHAIVEVNPIFIYREFPEFKENFDQRQDLLFVGSFKHPGNLDGVDWLCKEIMPKVIKAMPDVKLHLVGAHPTPKIKALANEHIIVHGFLSDEELAEMYSRCRLSVVPLRFGAGVKGKVLEAMYHGLPIVSTSIGTEGIVDIEQCIENTDGTEAFAAKIIELYPQVDQLTKMGRTNWQYVQDHLGIEPAKALFRRSFNAE